MNAHIDRFRLADTNFLIADAMPASSEVTRNALYDLGVRNFTIVKSVAQAREKLETYDFDVFISDAYLVGEGTASIVTDLRQGNLGNDPFIPVIATTWEPTIEIVHELVSAGVDQMLTLPVSTNKISQTLTALIEKRKPFVVTSRYIDPDRRKTPRLEGQQVPQIKVPNVLRRKVTGDDGGISLDEVLQTIRNQRVERFAYRIVHTIGKIAGLVNDQSQGTTTAWLSDLHVTVDELTRHVSDTLYQHHQTLCETLLEVVERNLDNDNPDSTEIETMQQLALSVQIGFSPDQTSTIDVAQDFSATETGYSLAA